MTNGIALAADLSIAANVAAAEACKALLDYSERDGELQQLNDALRLARQWRSLDREAQETFAAAVTP